jgi:hypothetical protein
MASIPPIVRHMLVCDAVGAGGAADRPTVNIAGMAHVVRAGPGESFPLTYPVLCVYLVLTGGVGTGRGQVIVADGDTDQPQFGTPVHDIRHPADRHDIQGVVFRLLDCVFPRPGLYWVEFRHDGMVLRREPLILR